MRLLIYNDSRVFGGHEEMLLRHVEQATWRRVSDVAFAYGACNQKLERGVFDALSRGKVTAAFSVRPGSARLDQFMGLLDLRRLAELLSLLWRYQPDVVLVVAGRIEGGNLAIWCANLLRIPVIDYLPMVHDRVQMSPSRIAGLRDLYNKLIYYLVDGYIVIAEHQRAKLASLRTKAFQVVPNVVDCPAVPGAAVRRRSPFTIGFLGRIDQQQKNVRLIVSVLRALRTDRVDVRLIVQGNGPSRSELTGAIETAGLSDRVEFREWSDDIELFFGAIDALLIPSFYEGVPLVMLQALVRCVPVVATAADGMAETLPPSALFPLGDARSAAACLARLDPRTEEWTRVFTATREKMLRYARAAHFSDRVEGFFPTENVESIKVV